MPGCRSASSLITGPLVTIPNDAFAAFTAEQNRFMPEFGHSTGGQLNAIVRSRSNAFHGIAYEYLAKRNLNAADNLSAID